MRACLSSWGINIDFGEIFFRYDVAVKIKSCEGGDGIMDIFHIII